MRDPCDLGVILNRIHALARRIEAREHARLTIPPRDAADRYLARMSSSRQARAQRRRLSRWPAISGPIKVNAEFPDDPGDGEHADV
jgi:hypothetical protein